MVPNYEYIKWMTIWREMETNLIRLVSPKISQSKSTEQGRNNRGVYSSEFQ